MGLEHLISKTIGKEFAFVRLLPLCAFSNITHHGESFLCVPQVVPDASGRQQEGEARHLVDDLTLGHHN